MKNEQPRFTMVQKVAWRDLLSVFKDKRTLISNIVMPLILIPLFALGFPALIASTQMGEAERVQQVGIIGELPPALQQNLTTDKKTKDGEVYSAAIELQKVTDPIQAIQNQDYAAVIKIPKALPTEAGKIGQIELYYKFNNLKSATGAPIKIKDAIESYNRQLLIDKIKLLGLNEQALKSIVIKRIDASPPEQQKGGLLVFLIPMMIMQMIVGGAQTIALDSTAGEKERGTLESLLVSPIRRSEVVAGKLLATTSMALFSAIISVLGFILTGLISTQFLSDNPITIQISLTPSNLLWMLLISLSSALLISSIFVSLGIFARSYKEGQSYFMPIVLLATLPAILLQFADFLEKGFILYIIPLVGGLIGILDVLKGEVSWSFILTAVIANLVGTLIASLLALRSFQREEVIFRN